METDQYFNWLVKAGPAVARFRRICVEMSLENTDSDTILNQMVFFKPGKFYPYEWR